LKNVEELALVFVNALDLKVEQRFGIDRDVQALVQKPPEALLVGGLDRGEARAKRVVFHEGLEPLQLPKIAEPGIGDAAADQRRELRVGLLQPAALRYAVGQ